MEKILSSSDFSNEENEEENQFPSNQFPSHFITNLLSNKLKDDFKLTINPKKNRNENTNKFSFDILNSNLSTKSQNFILNKAKTLQVLSFLSFFCSFL